MMLLAAESSVEERTHDTTQLEIDDSVERYCNLCGELHVFKVFSFWEGVACGQTKDCRKVGGDYSQYLDRDYVPAAIDQKAAG